MMTRWLIGVFADSQKMATAYQVSNEGSCTTAEGSKASSEQVKAFRAFLRGKGLTP